MTALPRLDPNPIAHLGAQPAIGLASLWRSAFAGGGITPYYAPLIERVRAHSDPYAMLDLSHVLQLDFQRDSALSLQGAAVQRQSLYRLQQAPRTQAPRILLLKAAGDLMSNAPVEFLFEQRDYTVDVLYVGMDIPWPDALPDHDVLWVAVAESDANQAVLGALDGLLAHWPRPVLNRPARIAQLARDRWHAQLRDIPGLIVPVTARVPRAALGGLAAGLAPLGSLQLDGGLPWIARPVGTHAGQGLGKFDSLAELDGYLQQHEADAYFVARYIDYASADGLYRKYRLVFVGGRPYLYHLGISSHWVVHYPYEEMMRNPARLAEEADAMRRFEDDFMRRHARALALLADRVGLPYWGLDCAQTRDGRLLAFEASSAMLVHGMDPADPFAHKLAQMSVIGDAVEQLLNAARP